MIRNTFLHFKNINTRTEKELWKQGILTWEDYAARQPRQLSLFEGASYPPGVHDSLAALATENISYFAERLHPHEFYRLALTFPNDILFLDIETTGLSIYYDIITLIGWSLGSEYGVYINGDDESLLAQVMRKAKLIVTFNGTLFDLKFIKKNFPSINLPCYHIDLRFFAKRVGMTGGQKAIEEQIGFRRNDTIEGILGEAAPILWHKYRRGDVDSLKKLIEYNHADVEGMKVILDKCIELFVAKNKFPKKIQPKFKFAKHRSMIKWNDSLSSDSKSGIFVPHYRGDIKPLITYSDLNDLISLDSFCVAGIDLVSSEEKESGFCLLTGNRAETSRIKSDDEMLALIIDSGANLVSIDSPLSIPVGRTTFWDDDPMRSEYGITRECERTLKKRGISSYPCLIPSMQRLTCRGMKLAGKLRKLGIPVIESYPGAAQDIMNIPRKQAGLQYLAEGLKDFGIVGDFLQIQVSHDELDAITSAIVGLFFWAGKFEGLGNAEEDYLIIPDLMADHEQWLRRKVVGFSGIIGAGKTTSATFLASQGYTVTRFSDILRKILQDQSTLITRSSLQEVGFEIYKTGKQRWLGKEVVRQVSGEKKVAIDGLRFPEDHASLIESFGPAFRHIYIECDQKARSTREIVGGEEDIPLNEALLHKVESGISQLASLAHSHIDNDSTKENLFSSIEDILRM